MVDASTDSRSRASAYRTGGPHARRQSTASSHAVTDPCHRTVVGPEERIAHLLEEIALADASGLYSFGIGEHHREEYYDSAPPVILGGRRRPDVADPARQRGHRAQRRRPGAGVPAVRHARPDLQGPDRPGRRARLVHRGVPVVRARPRRLRLAFRREARSAAEDPRLRARHLVRPAPPGADRPGRLPAAGAGPAADLGRRRRHPGVVRRGPVCSGCR